MTNSDLYRNCWVQRPLSCPTTAHLPFSGPGVCRELDGVIPDFAAIYAANSTVTAPVAYEAYCAIIDFENEIRALTDDPNFVGSDSSLTYLLGRDTRDWLRAQSSLCRSTWLECYLATIVELAAMFETGSFEQLREFDGYAFWHIVQATVRSDRRDNTIGQRRFVDPDDPNMTRLTRDPYVDLGDLFKVFSPGAFAALPSSPKDWFEPNPR